MKEVNDNNFAELVTENSRHTVVAQCIHGFDHGAAIALCQGCNQAKHIATIHAAQHLPHSVFLQLAAAKSNRLVRQ